MEYDTENHREVMESPNSKRLMPIQVVSFKVFEQFQKPKMKARYPFLPNEQICLKLRDLWKTMDINERRLYTKTTLRLTPIKQWSATSKQGKRKSGSSNHRGSAKKAKLNVFEGKSPNIFQDKLDRRDRSHPNNYKSDFEDCPMNLNNSSSSYRSLSYLTASHNVLQSSADADKTKRLLKVTPLKQKQTSLSPTTSSQGILRNSAEKKTSGKGRVSFSGTTAVYLRSSDNTDCEQTSDDDSQGLLLTRNSVDGSSPTLNPDVQGRYQSNSDDESDNEGSALLIRRDDTLGFDEAENHELMVEDEYPTPYQVTQTKNLTKHDNNSDSDDERSKSPDKFIKRNRKTVTQKAQSQNASKADFKSPMLSSKKKRGRESKKKADKFETPCNTNQQTVAGSSANETVPNLTPQMDETLQQLTLLMVSKAPQKNRQSVESNIRDIEKVVSSGRRVTRSLLAKGQESTIPVNNKVTQNNRGCVGGIKIDMKGDAGCLDQRQKVPEDNENVMDTNVESMPHTHGKRVRKRRHTQDSKGYSPLPSKQPSSRSNIQFLKSQSESPDLSLYNSPASSYKSGSSQSLEWGSPHNPALEKALKNLRYREVSPAVASTVESSPNLLSPTLSGVSEFSSGDNSGSSSQRSDAGDMRIPEVKTLKLPPKRTMLQQPDLCDMFQDANLSKAGRKSVVPRTRMLRSCPEGFTEEMFDSEEIF